MTKATMHSVHKLTGPKKEKKNTNAGLMYGPVFNDRQE